ncbi:hypothetical protein KKH26_01375, partial [Patescibacteria group bacterium]|nr:hypothetical protein [Patescibacteria group bacterium]
MSTLSSDIMVTSCPRGVLIFFPTKCVYLLSFGFTNTAAQAGSNSGRVVAVLGNHPQTVGYVKPEL